MYEEYGLIKKKKKKKKIGGTIGQSYRQLRLNLYIPVSHTNRRSIKNMIGVVVKRLVGMGLKVKSKGS